MDNFDLKKYLIENKLTYQEKMKEAAEGSVSVDSSDMNKIMQAPEVQKLAAAVAKDSQAVAKLSQLMKKAGVTLQESEGTGIDGDDVKKIANVLTPFLKEWAQSDSRDQSNSEPETAAGTKIVNGAIGAAGAMFVPGALEAVNNALGLAAYNPAGGIAALGVGALLGAIYALISGKKTPNSDDTMKNKLKSSGFDVSEAKKEKLNESRTFFGKY